MPKRYMAGSEHNADPETKPETALETQDVTPPEPETHPHIDDETPHVDPTGASDFDRPYDQWSNADLKVRAKQLGIVGVVGHGQLIDKIREAERRLEEQEATPAKGL